MLLKSSELSYQFALRCKRANIKANEKVVLEGEDLYYNYWPVKTIFGANIMAHSRKALKSKGTLCNFCL